MSETQNAMSKVRRLEGIKTQLYSLARLHSQHVDIAREKRLAEDKVARLELKLAAAKTGVERLTLREARVAREYHELETKIAEVLV